jgi:transcriptional regulator with XRE-family HTH domain
LPRHPRTAARQELADFLRSRRARLVPADVALPITKRRRTPGLRREEVAHLAGVGLTWYTWLEQGRAIEVSSHFLEQIARALRLDGQERAHLFVLANNRAPLAGNAGSFAVDPGHQRMLDCFEGPAYIATANLDVLAWNEALNAVFGDLSLVPAENRNMVWLMFADPAQRASIPNWAEAARAMLARFRIEYGRNQGDERFNHLIDRLCAVSSEFLAWWSQHDVTIKPEEPKRFSSPLVGEMELEQTTLLLEGAVGTRLMIYAPANPESAARIATLRQIWLAGRRP